MRKITKRKKALISAVLSLVVMLASLVGCAGESSNSGQTDSSGEGDDKIHLEIAYMVDVADTSMQTQFNVSKTYCDYLNDTRDDLDINVTMYDAKSSVETQIANFETCLAAEVDGIVLSAVDNEAIAPYIKQAQDAGIPVLDWRSDGGTVNFVGANETEWGEMNADWVREQLDADPDLVFNAGIEFGATTHPQCFPRLSALEKLEEEYPGRFNVLVKKNGDWSQETCQKMVEDWLQAYTEMNFISKASDNSYFSTIFVQCFCCRIRNGTSYTSTNNADLF